jgi:hypothetical protein
LCDVGCLKERGKYGSKGVGCFDGRGRLCLCVVFIRANINVCICEKMIFFHGFTMGNNNWQNNHEIRNKTNLGCSKLHLQ